MEKYLENLNWRYATKKFDTSKKIPEADLNKLKEAMRLSASSYGLQPYEVFIISDPETRQKLRDASFGQPQITDSSHLVVFASHKTITQTHVDDYMKNISKTRDMNLEDLNGLSQTIQNTTLQLPKAQQAVWASKQTYIALGNLLSATANMGIDACPMEGFDNEGYDELLKLSEKNLHASVIAAIGYRSQDDPIQHYAKVRKATNDLFIEI